MERYTKKGERKLLAFFSIVIFLNTILEWQVIGAAFICSLWSWRERSCCATRGSCSGRSTHAWSWWEWCTARLHAGKSIGIHMDHIPCTNIVEPTALILMGCNVERHIDFITTLYVELGKTLSAKHVKNHLLGILLMGFDHKRL